MKELFNYLLKLLKERIDNPFIRSFLFSWIILNWKAIVILFFSSITIVERIQLIEKTYSEIAYRLWLPLLIAIFYVIILPYIMWVIEDISKLAYIERQSILYDKKTAVIKEKQKVAEEEVELENTKADYREKSELNLKIKSLENEIDISNKSKIE